MTDPTRTDDPSLHDRDHAFADVLAAGRFEPARIFPLKRDVAVFAEDLLGILFPQLSGDSTATATDIAAHLVMAQRDLRRLLGMLVGAARAGSMASGFAEALPEVHARLLLDAEAITSGDPAAESVDEVIAAYPGFLAIAIHRLAHEIHGMGAPILPRLLAEVAHTRTGIDIHPGARIGRSFCIDHGTGVVVGETAVIGDDVKLYQGVTLGALSVARSQAAGTRSVRASGRIHAPRPRQAPSRIGWIGLASS